jgi:hypothetical protein
MPRTFLVGAIGISLLLAALTSRPFNLLNVLAAGIIAGPALLWPRVT